MSEEKKINNLTEPQVKEELSEPISETIPKEDGVKIPVKFNKEIKELTQAEASELAQKGMKFELISKEFERLKRLSCNAGKSIPEFLDSIEQAWQEERIKELSEKCGGNEEMAKHIAVLESNENKENNDSFSELKSFFPEFESKEQLPEQVLSSAELKGTLLLDEYLRYILSSKREEKRISEMQKNAQKASIGPQINHKSGITPEAQEFLKGLWK